MIRCLLGGFFFYFLPELDLDECSRTLQNRGHDDPDPDRQMLRPTLLRKLWDTVLLQMKSYSLCAHGLAREVERKKSCSKGSCGTLSSSLTRVNGEFTNASGYWGPCRNLYEICGHTWARGSLGSIPVAVMHSEIIDDASAKICAKQRRFLTTSSTRWTKLENFGQIFGKLRGLTAKQD